MCGIWILLGSPYVSERHKPEFLRIAGRGPDKSVIADVEPGLVLGFHRLAIVTPGDRESSQPVVADGLSVVCNGEIYNHERIKTDSPLDNGLVLNGGSDCAAIIHSFRLANGDLRRACGMLDGVFAFGMADSRFLYVGRDPLGVRPLFFGRQSDGSLVFGSEAKCVEKLVEKVELFPPGCCAQIPLKRIHSAIHFQQYFVIPTIPERSVHFTEATEKLRSLLINAVRKRLMGNRQFGFMLSGGLDSSLIAAIASRFLREPKPVAFSVGFGDSPDLQNAKLISEFLGIPHRVLTITPQQCVDIVPRVIYALETFDPLIIRCGIPHFLLCEHISASSDVKVLLSGEGADELFGSYAYMQRAPNAAHFHREILRRLKHLHQYDVLRCDRATSCHGLEIRVPFLDKAFVDYSARLPPATKLAADQMEKNILRSAFRGWIPNEVLWRSKEGFAEALGKTDLGEIMEDHSAAIISQQQWEKRQKRFPWKTPDSKEEFWYRSLFEERFDVKKMDSIIHTRIYRTAEWESVEEKENRGNEVRRRSTGSFAAVA